MDNLAAANNELNANVGVAIPMITDGTVPPTEVADGVDVDRKKRSKKTGADSSSLGSAGSREESVRSQ